MKPANRSALLCGLGAFAITSALILIAEARADAPPSREVTVDGVNYSVCVEEDCSDQPGQIGVWIDSDTGDAWLSRGEYSVYVQPGPESYEAAADNPYAFVPGCGWDYDPDDDSGCAD